MNATPFQWPVRVYWEDTDAGGVVYHAGYVRFLERARTEWLRARGLCQSRMEQLLVVHRLGLVFHAPARLDELLQVDVRVAEVRRARFRLDQTIQSASGRCLISAEVTVACVDRERFRPCPLPDVVLKELLG
jgi:acyl-CoA thioester hydrolase